MYAGSKLRLNGPRFLVYAIIDTAVDELFPMMRTMRKEVRGPACVCAVLSSAHTSQDCLIPHPFISVWASIRMCLHA
jgi:hypothetical protein